MTLTLFSNPMSRGRIARWMLEEVGEPYQIEVLEYGTTIKSPDYLALNPMGKVPSLVHDGALVTETAAICLYLADAFPQSGLIGTNRAAYFRWILFAAGPLEAAITNTALGLIPPPDRERMVNSGTYATALSALQTAAADDALMPK